MFRKYAMAAVVAAFGGILPQAGASVTVTNSTNFTLANNYSVSPTGGNTQTIPYVNNGPVGALLPYTATASAGFFASPFDASALNNGDVGPSTPGTGNYAIPVADGSGNGTVTLTFSAPTSIGSIAIYDGYTNRDDGTYLLKDGSANTIGGYTIVTAVNHSDNSGTDAMWFTFNSPVTSSSLVLSYHAADPNSSPTSTSFREIQVFGTVPEPGTLSLLGIATAGLLGRRRASH